MEKIKKGWRIIIDTVNFTQAQPVVWFEGGAGFCFELFVLDKYSIYYLIEINQQFSVN